MGAVDSWDFNRIEKHVDEISREMGVTEVSCKVVRSGLFKVSWKTESYIFDGRRKEALQLSVPAYMKWASDEALDEFIIKAITDAYTVGGELNPAIKSKEICLDHFNRYIWSDEFITHGREAYMLNNRRIVEEIDPSGPLHQSYSRLRTANLVPEVDLRFLICNVPSDSRRGKSQTHIMLKMVEVPEDLLSGIDSDNTLDWLIYNQVMLMTHPFDVYGKTHVDLLQEGTQQFPRIRKDAAKKDLQYNGLWRFWMSKYI